MRSSVCTAKSAYSGRFLRFVQPAWRMLSPGGRANRVWASLEENCAALQAAKKRLHSGGNTRSEPQGIEPMEILGGLMYGLKPVPFICYWLSSARLKPCPFKTGEAGPRHGGQAFDSPPRRTA